MDVPDCETLLPKLSWICTVTAGAMAEPDWVSVGCWTKNSLLAVAGFTVKLLLVGWVSEPSLAASVYEPLFVGIKLEKVATPFIAATLRVDPTLNTPPPLIAIV